jgi:hypothetical protein
VIGNKYEQAVAETRSVLDEWLTGTYHDIVATKVVERLIAKGIIQDTDPSELVKVY